MEEKPKGPELRIYLAYDLKAYFGVGTSGAIRVGTGLSGREYPLWRPEPRAEVRGSGILSGQPAPALQAAGAVCATVPAL